MNSLQFACSSASMFHVTGGLVFLFDRKALKYFRKDEHNWRKKKDGKTVKEAHEKLKERIHDPEKMKEQFNDMFFLILLCRTFGKTNESQRRHLMTTYYDETEQPTTCSSFAMKRKMSIDTTDEEGTSKRKQVTDSKDTVADINELKD